PGFGQKQHDLAVSDRRIGKLRSATHELPPVSIWRSTIAVSAATRPLSLVRLTGMPLGAPNLADAETERSGARHQRRCRRYLPGRRWLDTFRERTRRHRRPRQRIQVAARGLPPDGSRILRW